MTGTFRQVIQTEGVGALMTGFSPTFAGYFLQGSLKFGGYEFWKKILIDSVGQENAARNRTAIYLVGATIAEFIVDIALCPLEATRIRLVSQPTFANDLVSGITRLVKEEGVYRDLYSRFGPIVFKQVPYNMSKFMVYEVAFEALWGGVSDPKSIISHLSGLANNLGFRGLFLGLSPRIIMVGLMSAFQFAIYGDLKRFFGTTKGVETEEE
ncbi:mitochondrial phosphate carrier protein [Linnemannia zychae]|nr:mitochondrial phosphate carrier protein [Linnemannia zychae]